VDGRPQVEIDDLGDANQLLSDRGHFLETARKLVRRGVIPAEDDWSGWLGRYRKGLRSAAIEIAKDAGHRQQIRPSRRSANRSRGR
jgi:hypothetical protein